MKLPQSRNDNILKFIKNFVFDKSLISLVNSFGGKYPKQSIEEYLNYLLEFSEIWDYRNKNTAKTENQENARWLIAKENFSTEQKQAIQEASLSLGLKNNSKPKKSYYDYIWILGGAKLSCLLRTKLAHVIYENLIPKPKNISILASFRPINESERDATDTYSPNANTEFDLFISAHNQYFKSNIHNVIDSDFKDNNPNKQWKIVEFSNNTSIFSAPSREPEIRRANSLDTYLFFMNHYSVAPKSKIILVTSEIYVPYQHLEALRGVALDYEVEIETVGFPAEWGGELQGMSSEENYLQEIRSTILSVNKLWLDFSKKIKNP